MLFLDCYASTRKHTTSLEVVSIESAPLWDSALPYPCMLHRCASEARGVHMTE